MKPEQRDRSITAAGLAGWILSKLSREPNGRSRLTLVDRISLAPRQSLALVEAEGRRFLVATSQENAPVLYPLDPEAGNSLSPRVRSSHRAWRVL